MENKITNNIKPLIIAALVIGGIVLVVNVTSNDIQQAAPVEQNLEAMQEEAKQAQKRAEKELLLAQKEQEKIQIMLEIEEIESGVDETEEVEEVEETPVDNAPEAKVQEAKK